MSITRSLHDILRTFFGYSSFRGEQGIIIQHIVSGGDALVLMPTGGGKSLCYQIPAIVRHGVGIVVSPLISLMQDQVSALSQAGVCARFVNSTLTSEQVREVSQQLRSNRLDLLYVTPERLIMPRFLEFLTTIQISLFAIDEAHCVSHWGHDFRPEYMQLSVLRDRFPQVPRVALTATADKPTRQEIITQLRLENAKLFIAGFDRPNIQYRVVEKNNPRHQLIQFLEAEHRGDAGIIYCLSRKKVEETAGWLQAKGWPAMPYHAKLSNEVRHYHQTRFQREEGLIMVATIAFGMGIDKSNVRFVAHLNLPKSLEAYYQETGRAGRDGLPANAWMTYNLEDIIILQKLIENSEADEEHKQLEQRRLNSLVDYCEVATCRRQALLAYFGDYSSKSCGNCDNCLQPVATWDGTEAAQKALSCIYRTGQRYGVHYLTDVLLGKVTDRIKQQNHHKISTFGIGKELTTEQWRSVFRQLVAGGFAALDIEGYRGLQLTENARPLLRGEQKIRLRKETKKPEQPTARLRHRFPFEFEGEDRVLWEALRAKRLELSTVQNIPPYVILHDSTLADIVRHKPDSLQALGCLSGIGKYKLDNYGAAFMNVMDEYVMKYKITSDAS